MLIVSLERSENTLLSRRKSINRYPERESQLQALLRDELPAPLYEDLLAEVPQLRPYLLPHPSPPLPSTTHSTPQTPPTVLPPNTTSLAPLVTRSRLHWRLQHLTTPPSPFTRLALRLPTLWPIPSDLDSWRRIQPDSWEKVQLIRRRANNINLEDVEIETEDKLEYQFYPVSGASVQFRVRAAHDAHVALTTGPQEADPMYEIFIGGWHNRKSAIRRNRTKPEKVKVRTPGILGAEEFRGFWVRWGNGDVEVGREGEAMPFMSWTDPKPFLIGFFGIRTSWGATGSWKIGAGFEEYESENKSDPVAWCYQCGVGEELIPRSSLCHDTFESLDGRLHGVARMLRVTCHPGRTRVKFRLDLQKEPPKVRRDLIGPYIGGCFKRFLDVGTVYTQRGCRQRRGAKAGSPRSSADHRFRRLEATLARVSNGCVMSPTASLTPFSRAISLYVRYHVCVCDTKWCNSTCKQTVQSSLFIFICTSTLLLFNLAYEYIYFY